MLSANDNSTTTAHPRYNQLVLEAGCCCCGWSAKAMAQRLAAAAAAELGLFKARWVWLWQLLSYLHVASRELDR
jgi:hypothetical protein